MQLSDSLSTSTQQQVTILDFDSFETLFASAHPMRVAVREEKRATKFAVEDGTERSDHVVRQLTEIQIDFLLVDDTRNQFESLQQAFQQNRPLTVQTKVKTYDSMMIVGMPHDETPELGMAVNVPIRLQEWSAVKPEFGELPPAKVENKSQSSTVKRGQQTSEASGAATERRGSVLGGVFK